ncbi:MAG: hypothetical protein HY822_10230 [Acidobacteria bacterium]|nr:hypothetical protein [Acidobacteriota bacterium]
MVPRPIRRFFSLKCRCPRCWGGDVHRFEELDEIERLYRNPISLLQALFGAPLYWCPFCRLQFYDFRKRAGKG